MGAAIFSLILCTIAFILDIISAISNAERKRWGWMALDICLTILMTLCIVFNITRINQLSNTAHGGNEIEASDTVQD